MRLHDAHVKRYRWRLAAIERNRAKRRAKAEAEGREMRAWVHRGHKHLPYNQKPGGRENRNEYKRMKRAEKGAKPRLLHDAHVRRHLAQTPVLHDAHVRLLRDTPTLLHRWRYRNDLGYVLNTRLRVQIRKALKGGKAGRKWERLVGYSVDELAAHFMRMLPAGLSLHECLNTGWHIDHIVPKSAFDLSDLRDLASAWALPNLRLIPAKENLSKGAKRLTLL